MMSLIFDKETIKAQSVAVIIKVLTFNTIADLRLKLAKRASGANVRLLCG